MQIDNNTSSFSVQDLNTTSTPDKLISEGATCLAYRTRFYGKLLFKKQLRPEYASDTRYQELFDKEFEIGYSLEHPSLTRYIFKSKDENGPYILMDYVDGLPLNEFVETYPNYFESRKNRKRFARQLLDVVKYIHDAQILHLDISPKNILITRIGHNVKLVDFGFAYNSTFDLSTGHNEAFAAPEQISGNRPYDQRADLYSLGKVLEFAWDRQTKLTKALTKDEREERCASADEALSLLGTNRLWLITIGILIIAVMAMAIWLLQPANKQKQNKVEKKTTTEATLPQDTDSMALSTSVADSADTELPKTDSNIVEIEKPDTPIIVQGQKEISTMPQESAPSSNEEKTNIKEEAPKKIVQTSKETIDPKNKFKDEIYKALYVKFDNFYNTNSVITDENCDNMTMRYTQIVHSCISEYDRIAPSYSQIPETERYSIYGQQIEALSTKFKVMLQKYSDEKSRE